MVNQSQPGLIFPVQKDILGNADIRNQCKLLIYGHDSLGKSLLCSVKLNGPAIQPDLPLFGLIRTQQALCKRALSRAVLTYQDVYLPLLQIKIHIIQGLHSRKKFGDMPRC